MSFRTPVENPGTRPPRSRVFGIACTLLAALASFGSLLPGWAVCRWRWSRPPRTCRQPGRRWLGTCRCSGAGRPTCWLGGEAAGHAGDVAATLGLAVSRLAGKAPAAAALLRLLAFLAPEPVPLPLLTSGPTAGQPDPAILAEAGLLLGDPVAAGVAVAALRRDSLISPAGDGLVLAHRLVQAITRAQLPVQAAAQWEQAAAALVERAVPASAELPASWPAYAVLLPHARAILAPTSSGMWRIANFLGPSGSYPAARDLFGLIADALTEDDAYGPEHPGTQAARHELASWAGEAGDAAGARDQFTALLVPLQNVVTGSDLRVR
jgi:hypothetical protein